MRCPQYGRYQPEKRASGAPRAIAGHAKGNGTITVEPQAPYRPITLATFRIDPKTGEPRGIGEGLKGMPRAQRQAIKARRAALTMHKAYGVQHAQAEAVRVLASGDQPREPYKSRDDRHRWYAWKGIKP